MKESVYALTPHPKWAKASLTCLCLGAAYVVLAWLCFVSRAGLATLRVVYSAMAVTGLLYRVFYYISREWILFFIDLCFVAGICGVWTLWVCADGSCSYEWLLANSIVGTGAVAGATFALQTPLTLHHPEAFESFFLHVTPMWISYCWRWRWGVFDSVPSVADLVAIAFRRFYIPWAAAYLCFLLTQPFLPDHVAGFETLMDLQLFPGATKGNRLLHKRGANYPRYVLKVIASLLLHAFLSWTGFVMAAMAFRCQLVNLLWIFLVQLGCFVSGYHFYKKCVNPQYEAPGLLRGFVYMGVAWMVIGPVYIFRCSE